VGRRRILLEFAAGSGDHAHPLAVAEDDPVVRAWYARALTGRG
jgi:hypothetical protein